MKASLAVFVLALGASKVSSAELDKMQLRQLADLPKPSLQFRLTFTSEHGLRFNQSIQSLAVEIDRQKKHLAENHRDAKGYLLLGDLLSRHGDFQEADKFYSYAINLCRQRLKEHPENMRYQAQLGDFMLRTRERHDGRLLIEQAVKKAPTDWYVWLIHGQELDSLSLLAVLKNPFHFRGDTRGEGESVFLDHKPTADQMEEMERLHREAQRCFDRAIALAPREIDTRLVRLGSITLHRLVCNELRSFPGNKLTWADVFLSPEIAAEARQIVRLSPDDPVVVGSGMMVDLLSCVRHDKEIVKSFNNSSKGFIKKGFRSLVDTLPAENRDFYLWGEARLEKLAKSSKPGVAAAASEQLAELLSLTSGPGRNKYFANAFLRSKECTLRILDHLHRAVQLDPSRERAWDLLLYTLWSENQLEETIHLARQRIKIKDNVQTHFLLAKLYAEQAKGDSARLELEAGLQTNPRDLRCRLGLIALLLKQDNAAAVRLAGKMLREIEHEIKQQGEESIVSSWLLLGGTQAALSGETDEAGKLFREILRKDAANTTAARALIALGAPLVPEDQALAISCLRARKVQLHREYELLGPITCAETDWTYASNEALFFLTALTHLRELRLCGSNITDEGLIHLKPLPDLKILVINCDSITDHGLRHLNRHNNICALELVHSKITDAGLAHLQGFHNLESLLIYPESSSLWDEKPEGITDVGIAYLKKLPKLRYLSLHFNVNDKGLAHIGNLIQLRRLNLIGTQITDRGLSHLKRLTELEAFCFDSKAVTDVGLANLKNLRKLKELRLGRSQITDAGLVNIKELLQIRILDLSDTLVTGSGLIHLRNLKRLRELNLSFGYPIPFRPQGFSGRDAKRLQITCDGINNLKHMRKLENLILDGRPIDDQALLQLSTLDQLRSLSLNQSKVSILGIAQLKKRLPNLKVTVR